MLSMTVITLLVAAFCGLSRRIVASLVGVLMLAMIGLAHLMVRQPMSIHHILLHGFHLLLVFNAAYAASALIGTLVW
ncbi:hypothetical protein [Pleomorphomonas sp. JP5]|uniref:hypothetical protein n=1 Tax=Pleomorphomonas sp. JP5 TaxID=2942998 RepID=UPI002043F584|nr:hypothetical protein [Pleomorphomonas sp. JP5]MCM5558579.1 hypothetical protein [Pleomorphomonas sp. JP5]